MGDRVGVAVQDVVAEPRWAPAKQCILKSGISGILAEPIWHKIKCEIPVLFDHFCAPFCHFNGILGLLAFLAISGSFWDKLGHFGPF